MTKQVGGLLVVTLAALALAAHGSAAKPDGGNWGWGEPETQEYFNSIQFGVADNGKSVKSMLIFWHCGNSDSYHRYENLPSPIKINKEDKFKLTGATDPPDDQNSKDFTLKGTFTSKSVGKFSMKVENCGAKKRGKFKLAEQT